MSKNAGGKRRKNNLLSSNDISLFCSQVVLILKAAIPLREGIGAISENIETAEGKKLILEMKEELDRNSSLSAALGKTGAFPDYMVNMARIGEKAGKLDNVMEALAGYYAREDRLRRRVRSAILYPLILVLMMAAVIAVMVVKALPTFNSVFLDMGGDMPATSRAVIGAGMTIGQSALVAVLILAVLLIVVMILSSTDAGSRRLAGFAARFGPARRLSGKIASARFASILSMMLSAGYDTSEALELIPDVIADQTVLEKIKKSREAVDAGESFAKALETARMFPGIYSSMIHVGVKTGNLDTVMNQLADLYSEEADDSINKAVSVIEPVMVAALSIVIGAILLAVMLPLMGIMSSIG